MSRVQELAEVLGARTDHTFFELLRVCEQLLPEDSQPQAHGPRRGSGAKVRLGGGASMAFPTREIRSVRHARDGHGGEVLAVDVAFMTLLGADSPLAPPLLERLLWAQEPEVREGAQGFLDMLNQRVLELLYLAWGRARLPVSGQWWAQDPLTRLLGELMALPELPKDSGLCSEDLLPFAGLLFARPRGRAGLRQLLRGFVPWDVQLQSGMPRLVNVPKEDQCGLGTPTACLAETLFLGQSFWDPSAGFRVQIGPIPADQAADLEPGGPLYRRVAALIEVWCQEPVAWELEIRLASEHLAGAMLSGVQPQARLGRNTFLGAPKAAHTALVVSQQTLLET